MHTDWSDNIIVATLADEPELHDTLAAVIERVKRPRDPSSPNTNIPSVILDFSAVRYINSSHLATLLRLHQHLGQSRSHLLLCSIDPDVLNVFALTGLDRVFHFAPTTALALAHIQLQSEINNNPNR